MLFRHHDNINSRVEAIDLAGLPPQLVAIFHLLKSCGAEHFAIFGGAVRDADYAAYHIKTVSIKDYDLRIWLPVNDFANHARAFIACLEKSIGNNVVLTPSPGTNNIRYVISYLEIELDISLRPIPAHFANLTIPVEAVAIDRSFDSDIGISAVAIAPNSKAYARPEYIADRENKTLTICQHGNLERVRVYLERMKTKFPDHTPTHQMTAALNF